MIKKLDKNSTQYGEHIQRFGKVYLKHTWSYQNQTPSPHCSLKQGSSWRPVVERGAEERKSIPTADIKVFFCFLFKVNILVYQVSVDEVGALQVSHPLTDIQTHPQHYILGQMAFSGSQVV